MKIKISDTELMLTERKKTENNREYAYRVLRDNIMTLQLFILVN